MLKEVPRKVRRRKSLPNLVFKVRRSLVSLLRRRPSSRCRGLLRPPAAAATRCLKPAFCFMGQICTIGKCRGKPTSLKVVPSLHRDLATVKFTFVLQTRLLRLLSCRLPCIAPTEVVKLPVRVRREHEIPYGERKQVDKHPCDIRPSVSGDNDEYGRQSQDKSK